MNIWYELISILIPFSWGKHIFMQNALLAILLMTPLFGMLGINVVNNRMAFFSDALGHSVLTGVAIGVLMGLQSPLWSMAIFSIIMAIVVSYVKNLTNSSTDTVIGVLSATSMALGIVMLSRGGGFNKYSSFLIGDLLSISPNEIGLLILFSIIFMIFWCIYFNNLILSSVHPSLARSRGINVRFLEMVFSVCLAVIVTISIQWVGILIVSSLLILPAASARNMAINVQQYHFFSIMIAIVSGITGLILSYYWNTATGATIVLVTCLFYLFSLIKRRLNM